MPFFSPFQNAGRLSVRGIKSLRAHPQNLIYPYLAFLFVIFTYPFIGRIVFSLWNHINRPTVVDELDNAAPHQFLAHLGIVSFVVFYTFFITAYFTCMISASTLAELEGRKPSLFYGLWAVLRRFFRVTKFALLAILFFPIGLVAQHKKLRSARGVFEAITSSFSLSMSQMAPAIMSGRSGVFATARQTVQTLGDLWKESLIIRITSFIGIIAIGSLSFLPKLVETYWFDSRTAHIVGWIVSVLLGLASYVLLRVSTAVMTTTLYHEAQNKK